MRPARRTRKIREWLRAGQWPAVGAAALAALGLGFVGFARHFAALGEPRPFSDLLYLALQLFTLESGSLAGPLPWQLEAARLLAPAVAGVAAAKALTLVFREQWQEVRLRRWRDHVVICGLGRKALLLARALRRRGDRVVVIEKDADNDLVEPLREEGALVLIGDARSSERLMRAGLRRAAHLVAVCGDDGDNAEIAVAALEVAEDRARAALPCLAHVFDPHLCELLRMREIERPSRRAVRLEFFNVFEAGARALLRDHPLPPAGAPRRRIVIAGLGRFGESLLLRAAANWRERSGPGDGKLPVTVIDRAAASKVDSLALRYPHLAEVCSLEARDLEFDSAEFHEAAFLTDAHGAIEVAGAYVCVDDDSVGLSAGLVLQQHLKGLPIPVVVRTVHDAGLASLLDRDRGGEGEFSNLHAFGLLDRTCTPELLSFELLARKIHQRYLEQQRAAGESPQRKPAMVPWERLSERYRESNRRQADHVGEKLRAAGCALAPLRSWEAAGFVFSDAEVEILARLEHERWCEEKWGEGWEEGERDEKRRTHPHLIDYDLLPEEVKELDREPARHLPSLLAEAGFEIVRL